MKFTYQNKKLNITKGKYITEIMNQKRNILGFVFAFFVSFAYSQVVVNQNDNITEIMELKKDVAKNEVLFQIQIYNGTISGANETMKSAKEQYKMPLFLVFETPNYKVRLGSFRTRLEAEKNLIEIRKVYPAAFVMSPKK